MDKLYGKKRKILKIIVRKYRKDGQVSKADIINSCKWSEYETVANLSELWCEGYFSSLHMDKDILPKAKALNYFRFETYDNFEITIKSIIFPIIVSFLTTLLTMWLKGLL